MRKTIGVSFIALGIVCLLAAIGLVFYNQIEADSAREASQAMLYDVKQIIVQAAEEKPVDDTVSSYAEKHETMPLIELYGYECVGILSIPVLELELPVLSDWDYDKLKKAPCQYFGTCYDTDYVIAAHNYPAHFGRLSELQEKDVVAFTDIAGNSFFYEVVLLETLPATATEEMITSGFDLSLYTCTPGGQNRVTVRCKHFIE